MGDLAVKSHKYALFLIAAATAVSIGLLTTRGLHKDYSLAAFVAERSPSYDALRRSMDEFVSNEMAIVALHRDDGDLDAMLAVAKHISDQAKTLPQVAKITTLNDVPTLVRGALGERLYEHPLFSQTLISQDRKTIAIVLQMNGEQSSGTIRRKTVGELKGIVAAERIAAPETAIILAGPYVTMIDMYEYVDRDLRTFSLAAIALVVITLAIVFRRPAPAVYALVVSTAATVCTLGVASALSLHTALITQMIVILVAILSVANCVHLAAAEEEEFAATPFYDWRTRTRRVLARLAAPCTGVMATTCAGFGSVSISSITPVRTFGILMVVGLLLALVFSLLLLPWLARWRTLSPPPPRVDRLGDGLRTVAGWLIPRRGRIVVAFAIGTVVIALGATRLGFESNFVKSFRRDSEVRHSYEFIESNLTPAGSIEVIVQRRDGASVATPHALASAKRFGADAVERFEPIRKALTPADILSLGGARTPTTQFEVDTLLALIDRAIDPSLARNFLSASHDALRINLRVSEGVQVADKLAMADELRTRAEAKFGDAFTVEVTGLYCFHAQLVSELWRDQFRALGLTCAAVVLALIVVLRSIKAGLIALGPTLLPIIVCVGAMGWTGIAIDMTTAMMLSVATGIAVDHAVHYLWRYRAELRDTGDVSYAMRRTHGSVGRPCVFSTIVIAGGFWILVLSRFLPTAYFGGLLGFAMCVALAANLLLLPALVVMFKPFQNRASSVRAN